mgnify:CR=1 FL=1
MPLGRDRSSARLRPLAVALTLAWLGAVTYLAVVPRPPEVPLVPRRHLDDLGHFGVHALLAGLLFLTLVLWPAHRRRPGRTALLAVALPFLYGLLLEGAQHLLPNRTASRQDVLLNGAGALTGATAALVVASLPLDLRWTWGGVGAATLAALGLLAGWTVARDPSLPRVGDHWHAHYTIRVCGRTLPPLPGTTGAVHTHGDGLIHVHPGVREQGRNATLALFMATSGGALTEDSLALPSGARYASGDPCPDGRPGRVTLRVNGRPVTPVGTYVPRDRDVIVLAFEPAP